VFYLAPFPSYSETLVENRRFKPILRILDAPLGVTPLEFRNDFWQQKTRVPGYRMALFA